MKKKALLSTVLVAAMVTGMLTGCGDTPANNDSSVSDQPVSSQPSEQPSDSSEEGSEVSDAGSGTLTWCWITTGILTEETALRWQPFSAMRRSMAQAPLP